MEVEFQDKDLKQLDTDPKTDGQYLPAVVKGYRKRLNIIRSAKNKADLSALRGNRFHSLSGKRSGQYSMGLSGNWRLILEIDETKTPTTVLVIEIVDYH